MSLSKELLDYIDAHEKEELDLLTTIARIPAFSNHEQQKAAYVKKWLEDVGAKGVYIDEADNVIYPVGDVTGPVTVFMAHTDVVFPDTEELPLEIKDGCIYCPGIGDDNANLAALLTVAKYIAQKGITPRNGGMLIVGNSGEEGLGNLRGSKQIVKDFGDRITEFVSLDGGKGHMVNRAVGSKRYKVTVTTEGGHSYGKFGNRNAIAYLASMIDTLYDMKVPEGGKTTYNVGTISGGTSVNTIAQYAEMLYEFRSDRQENLDIMEKHFESVIACYKTKGIGVEVELMGDRPCMGNVDPAKQADLEARAKAIADFYYGVDHKLGSGSTDCNSSFAKGIPSICLGCYEGEGAHTRGEHVRLDSLKDGLKIAFDFILSYYNA